MYRKRRYIRNPALQKKILAVPTTPLDLSDGNNELWNSIPTEFKKFPELPPELRLMIWRSFLSPARALLFDAASDLPEIWDLKRLHRGPTENPDLPEIWDLQRTLTENPPALRINRESRGEALRYYSVLVEHMNGRKIYFNPSIDRIHIRSLKQPFPSLKITHTSEAWVWKGADLVRFVELGPVQRAAKWAYWPWYHKKPWGCPHDVEHVGNFFPGVVELTLAPHHAYFFGHNLERPGVLRILYHFLGQEFKRGARESEFDHHTAPKIAIWGFPNIP